jgi:hypothetical protein
MAGEPRKDGVRRTVTSLTESETRSMTRSIKQPRQRTIQANTARRKERSFLHLALNMTSIIALPFIILTGLPFSCRAREAWSATTASMRSLLLSSKTWRIKYGKCRASARLPCALFMIPIKNRCKLRSVRSGG